MPFCNLNLHHLLNRLVLSASYTLFMLFYWQYITFYLSLLVKTFLKYRHNSNPVTESIKLIKIRTEQKQWEILFKCSKAFLIIQLLFYWVFLQTVKRDKRKNNKMIIFVILAASRCTELEILLKLNQMKTVSGQDQRYSFLCHCLRSHSPSPRFCHCIFLSLSVCPMKRLSIILVHSEKKLSYWYSWKFCDTFLL